ncbi:MAG: hypothetical protein A3B68_09940 [Candidatus Melainabacteria bacterium RIFCSPHIGHO2_02_FULL_34_12]|nr:MAG: hypothetical protein A3B68_09940 [Candidatus Melainabacteria bacterium RIFCSPHIGHO2_02_FULL_34_12]
MQKRRYPAEWEKQRATWLSWPHNKKEWEHRQYGKSAKGQINRIREFYIKLILTILDFQDVKLILPDEKTLSSIEALRATPLRKKHKLHKIIIPNNDVWIRDYGPFFMNVIASERSERSNPDRDCFVANAPRNDIFMLDFEFNAWGGKFPPWDLDNKVPKEISKYLGIEIESYPIILEGGGLEFSGDGLILTTEQYLLNKNRNPTLNKNQIETILKSAFNIEEIIWLKRGLEGDHTDGHIDDVARFVGNRKVLICSTKDKKDKNHKHLNESIKYLKSWRHPKKKYKLEVIEILLPDKMNLKDKRLPNSYVNFIFVNKGVIVPVFNCSTDKEALVIFKKIFPKRKIVGLDCTLLIQEGGGIHCMTKQEPSVIQN